jgi:hypothetical protein
MAKFQVTAPAGGYNGTVGNVQFHDGHAVIDNEKNPAELAYCRNAGYLIEDADGNPAEAAQDKAEAEKTDTKPAPRRAPAKKEADK